MAKRKRPTSLAELRPDLTPEQIAEIEAFMGPAPEPDKGGRPGKIAHDIALARHFALYYSTRQHKQTMAAAFKSFRNTAEFRALMAKDASGKKAESEKSLVRKERRGRQAYVEKRLSEQAERQALGLAPRRSLIRVKN